MLSRDLCVERRVRKESPRRGAAFERSDPLLETSVNEAFASRFAQTEEQAPLARVIMVALTTIHSGVPDCPL